MQTVGDQIHLLLDHLEASFPNLSNLSVSATCLIKMEPRSDTKRMSVSCNRNEYSGEWRYDFMEDEIESVSIMRNTIQSFKQSLDLLNKGLAKWSSYQCVN